MNVFDAEEERRKIREVTEALRPPRHVHLLSKKARFKTLCGAEAMKYADGFYTNMAELCVHNLYDQVKNGGELKVTCPGCLLGGE